LWLGLGLLPAATLLLLGWLTQGLSPWSAALGAGLGFLALGGIASAFRIGGAARLFGAGAALVLAPWLWRVFAVRGSDRARLTVLPEDGGPRLLSKLYPERDGTLLAARLLGLTRPLRDPESARFPEILSQAFARTEPSADDVPTPAIATYLSLESPSQFDTLVLAPPPGRVASDAALVFLHGYAGNFYIYCWEVAQAAAAANLLTLCPAMDATGAWWSAGGEQTLRATLDYAHRIGMNRIYLAGLSNGAAGASVLALTHVRELSGLVLVSGTRAEHPPTLPTLVIQGDRDEMMPAAVARAYAAHAPRAQYREIAGGHFILLSRFEQVRPLIASFLVSLEQQAPGSPAFLGKPRR
jgi:pimeloyl-ACP methyl ester carboxylesterase